MLSLQPEQCTERVPQPSSPCQCHSYITVPMLAAAGSAHARTQCQGQLGTSAEPQEQQQEQLLVEPWPHICGQHQEPSHLHMQAWALKLCDMLFVCK